MGAISRWGMAAKIRQMRRGHIAQGRGLRDAGAQQRPRRAHARPAPAHAQHRQGQGNAHLAHLLDELGNGRGHHAPVALHVAPKGAHDAHQQHAGRDGDIAQAAFRRAHALAQIPAAQQQQQRADEAQQRQGGRRHAKDPPGVAGILPGDMVGNHAGDGHGNARRGHRQQHVIGREHLGIDAQPLAADIIRQGDAVQHAHHLADQPGQAQNGNAAHQRLALFRHKKASEM